jgi:hypothetical protein
MMVHVPFAYCSAKEVVPGVAALPTAMQAAAAEQESGSGRRWLIRR